MEKEVSGMYKIYTNENGNCLIGKFTICNSTNGKIWIQCGDDDGRDFNEKALEKVIETFYNNNF